MAQGWISLNREVMNHWVWDCEFSHGQAWVDLILYANHSPAKLMIKGQLVNIARGQQARSELTLSKSWKWSRNKVRRFLKNLQSDGMIEIKSGHLTTVITICNYDSFQSIDTADGTAKGQQTKQLKDNKRNTNNNVNNENNENKKNGRFKKPTEEDLISYFKEYCSTGNFDISFGEHRRFYDFYESKNWYVGKNKMKDWKAAVRNWLSKHKKEPVTPQQRPRAFGE